MRSLVPILGNQLVALVLGLIGVKLISHFVPAVPYGYYAIFVTLAQISMLVTHSDVTNHATRYWQRETARPGTYARFLWSVSWRKVTLLAPLLLAILLIRAWTQREMIWVWMFPLLLLSNFGLTFNAIGTGVLNADRKPWHVLLLSSVGTAARVFLPIGLGLLTQMNFAALSIGYTLHGIIIIACLVMILRDVIGAPTPTAEMVREWMQELRNYGRPFLFLGIGGWLLLHVDRWIVDQFYEKARVGFFNYAANLGGIIPTITATAMMQAFFPGIFRRADLAETPGDWRKIAYRCDQLTIGFVVLSLGGLVALHLTAPLLIGWLIDRQYAAVLPMIVPAGLVMVNSQINQFYYLLLQGQHNSAGMVWVMLVVAAIKTLGGTVAAAISWEAFLVWLMIAPLLCGGLGRTIILHMTLKRPMGPPDPILASMQRGPDATSYHDETG
jgi:O-antigen/teichoic acid export membrane protein